MTEFEMIMKSCEADKDMIVGTLESKNGYRLMMFKKQYLYNHNYFYDVSYHIFNDNDKRIYSGISYTQAYSVYFNKIKKG